MGTKTRLTLIAVMYLSWFSMLISSYWVSIPFGVFITSCMGILVSVLLLGEQNKFVVDKEKNSWKKN